MIQKTARGDAGAGTVPVVEVEGLWVESDGRTVLEDIDLTVSDRDFLGLIGPNGGGKSTLLKAILGLVRPSRGSVRVLGKSPEQSRHHVGYMPQKTLFDRDFPITALEVVMMGRLHHAGLMHRFGKDDRKRAEEALASVSMLDKASRPIGALSGGEQQRVFVARAAVSQPRLLLLDEPEAGIDAAQRAEFYELLSDLNRDMAIILVSHDISAVSSHVQKVACLNRRLYYHGSKELTAHDLEEAYQCPIDLIAHGMPHRVLRDH